MLLQAAPAFGFGAAAAGAPFGGFGAGAPFGGALAAGTGFSFGGAAPFGNPPAAASAENDGDDAAAAQEVRVSAYLIMHLDYFAQPYLYLAYSDLPGDAKRLNPRRLRSSTDQVGSPRSF